MRTSWVWIGMGAVLCMTACREVSPPPAGRPAGASSAGIVAVDAGDVSADPYARATRALSEHRMLSPAGNNAVEHYLAARAAATDQARADAALAELQPYVLIAAEQAIARGDSVEAVRLRNLIERIDARAPALPRLRAAMATLARAQAAQATVAVQTSTIDAAAPARSTASAAVAPATTVLPSRDVESSPTSPPPASTQTTQATQGTPQLPAPPDATPRIVQAPRVPRLVQDAQPRYPLPALRARIEGQADVAFTIQPDGSVRDVRLVSSTPSGMFDASALAVAQRWRFEATGQAHASSRTVRFRLPDAEKGGG